MNKPTDKTFSQLLKNNVVPLISHPELNGINPVGYDNMKKESPKPLEFILYPWFPVQGIAFVYAATGVGKTMFTMNVAYAIAGGGSFLKYKCPKPRRVLYIDGEMAYAQLHSRFTQIVKQQGELDFPENWYLLTPDKFLPHRLPKICDTAGQAYYNRVIDDFKIEVLVLDNLSTLSSIDENNSEQWKIIQDWLIFLRTKGIAVIVVHHAGKDKRGYRGTSRMLDCADTAISLQDVSQNELEIDTINGKKFKIEYQKARSFDGPDSFPFEVCLTSSGWSFQSIEKTTTERVIDMLKLKMTHKEIGQELGCTRSYISRLIRKAIRDGLINSA